MDRAREFIMVADDDKDDHRFLLEALEANHCFVPLQSLYDGAEVIAALQNDASPLPTAILLDLNMPKIGGYHVLKYIRQNPAWDTIPVFVFTTSTYPAERDQCMAAGANGFFVKPSTFTALVQIVIALIGLIGSSKLCDGA